MDGNPRTSHKRTLQSDEKPYNLQPKKKTKVSEDDGIMSFPKTHDQLSNIEETNPSQSSFDDPRTSTNESENPEIELFTCKRKECTSTPFTTLGSLLRHISHAKLCKDFYGTQKLDAMKKDL